MSTFTPILIAAILSATATEAAEMPSFKTYCKEAAQFQFPTNPLKRFMVYSECSSFENKMKDELARHWLLVKDEDVKICLKYRGKKYGINSYSSLMGCLSEIVGERCYSGELNCRGEIL